MRFHPTKNQWRKAIAFFLLTCTLVISCSKDPDLVRDAKFYDDVKNVDPADNQSSGSSNTTNTENTGTQDSAGQGGSESTDTDTDLDDGFVTRTVVFPPTDDAYLQSGKGYNENLIRLEEGSRTSYLRFDLSPIAAIGGYIVDARFQFTVTTDGGDGEISVFKGLNTAWTEQDLDFDSAPESDILLGAIDDTYVIGSTQEILLSPGDLVPEETTLILYHSKGNDLALASKEHPSKAWPRLRIEYRGPKDAAPIEPEDPTVGTESEGSGDSGTDGSGDGGTGGTDGSGDGGTGGTDSGDTGSGDSGTGEEGTTEGEATNQPPNAVVSGTPVNGTAPLEVAFRGNNSSDDTAIQSYLWDFKDGSTSTAINPTHTFTEPGTYNVSLTVEDAEGLSDIAVLTVTVQEPPNEAPTAVAAASVTSGEAPLTVQFNANASDDDKGIVGYYWDFSRDDPSSAKNPSRTFTVAGDYLVSLTVRDAEGLEDTDTIVISVSEPAVQNQPPVAQIDANPITGTVPLTVSYSADGSTDDSGIVDYSWDFGNTEAGNGVSTQNTFNNPGTYTTTLTVTDAQGLQSSDTVTITVEAASGGGDTGGGGTGCSTNGGKANETGLKTWCWQDVNLPVYSGKKGVTFSNSQLAHDSECNEQQITKVGNELRFFVDPVNPTPGSWCSNSYNMRAEIRTMPWNVRHPVGTEEWFGWTYRFGNSYKIDQENPWLIFQVHNGVIGASPHLEFLIGSKDRNAGEIYVVNKGNNNEVSGTGYVPRAGDKLEFVVHAIWDDTSNGQLQVWINGNLVYNKRVPTVYSSHPWGGNAKFGMYKWKWRNGSGVQASANQGITHIETFLGPLRILTRRPGDAGYGTDAYSQVAPR